MRQSAFHSSSARCVLSLSYSNRTSNHCCARSLPKWTSRGVCSFARKYRDRGQLPDRDHLPEPQQPASQLPSLREIAQVVLRKRTPSSAHQEQPIFVGVWSEVALFGTLIVTY